MDTFYIYTRIFVERPWHEGSTLPGVWGLQLIKMSFWGIGLGYNTERHHLQIHLGPFSVVLGRLYSPTMSDWERYEGPVPRLLTREEEIEYVKERLAKEAVRIARERSGDLAGMDETSSWYRER